MKRQVEVLQSMKLFNRPRLKGCDTPIFEAKLDRGQCILWTKLSHVVRRLTFSQDGPDVVHFFAWPMKYNGVL